MQNYDDSWAKNQQGPHSRETAEALAQASPPGSGGAGLGDRRSPTLILTGFGPFPGVPFNVSALFAQRLSAALCRTFPHLTVLCEILPVDWRAAPERLERLRETAGAPLFLHFGVSSKADGFILEQCAYNGAANVPDAAGALPPPARLLKGGAASLRASLPVARIAGRLESAGFPASPSTDPGRYLCNAVFYHSLLQAADTSARRLAAPPLTGFIHIPARLGVGGCLDWSTALAGGLLIAETALAAAENR